MTTTITIDAEEGKLVYLGVKADGSANWRLLKAKGQGKGTLPVPLRLTRQARRAEREAE